jgi:hypothetical protein
VVQGEGRKRGGDAGRRDRPETKKAPCLRQPGFTRFAGSLRKFTQGGRDDGAIYRLHVNHKLKPGNCVPGSMNPNRPLQVQMQEQGGQDLGAIYRLHVNHGLKTRKLRARFDEPEPAATNSKAKAKRTGPWIPRCGVIQI